MIGEIGIVLLYIGAFGLSDLFLDYFRINKYHERIIYFIVMLCISYFIYQGFKKENYINFSFVEKEEEKIEDKTEKYPIEEPGKEPGYTGLTAEFYKKNYEKIKNMKHPEGIDLSIYGWPSSRNERTTEFLDLTRFIKGKIPLPVNPDFNI